LLVADDHSLVLDRLVALLKTRFNIVDAVRDGYVLLEAAERLKPQVVVTDISMVGLNGLEALRRLKIAHPAMKVIVLTMHADPEVAREAIDLGASGFVVKSRAAEELVEAIESALKGGVYRTSDTPH
jgi:DNA-binding NarL/FixJ family response regulator